MRTPCWYAVRPEDRGLHGFVCFASDCPARAASRKRLASSDSDLADEARGVTTDDPEAAVSILEADIGQLEVRLRI